MITITEKQKAIVIAIGVLVTTAGFANIGGLIDQLPKDFELIITAVSTVITAITAYFKKVEDTIKD